MAYTPTLLDRPEDLGVNKFSPAAAGGSQTEYMNVYDYPLPEFTDLFTRHVNYVGFATMLKSMGYSRGKDTATTGHYELPWMEDLITIDSIEAAAGGAGLPMTIAIPAAAMYDTSMTANGTGVETSYPIVGDVIEAYDGVQARIIAKDTTATPHQFDISPLDSANDLDDSFAAGSSYFISHNLSAEGSALPAGRSPRTVKWNTTFGIVKTAYASTGTEWTNRVQFQPRPGETGSVNVLIESETLRGHERSRSNFLLYGQESDQVEFVTMMNADMAVRGTEGFIRFAKLSGTTDNYTLGSYTLDDLDAVGNILEDERATSSSDIMAWQGTNAYTQIENLLQQTNVNNLEPFVNKYLPDYASYWRESFASKDANVDWGFHIGFFSIRKRGFNYFLKKLAEMSDIRGGGYQPSAGEGYEYKDTTIFVPLDMVLNRSTKERLPMIGYEYKELDGYSRETVFGQFGGVGVGNTSKFPFAPSSPNDIYNMGLVSEIAGHWACGNKIVYQTPTASS